MSTYIVRNSAMATTAAPTKVTTGTAIKTLLQLAPSSGNPIVVKEWGISFDGSAAATPIAVELVDTYAVAATVTAFVANDVQPYLRLSDVGASSVTLGTAASGYTASAEGTITQTRHGDLQLVAPSSQYVKQMPLGMEFFVPGGHFLRIRVTAPTAVNAWCYVIYQDM
ncbi:hypothetical protein LQ327_09105 [Actinomycetospora endophytica]|uniref:Uncharacterized protein n=1 Tax=Actinomycetospora endophytica TaxID=2291215 RepID=A0ABS8P5J9_9PSEU|nr:hypothetical protein [Actinomycetospora endophytica]MCD2193540.1 hypothetical protein [Actinomycetospora endophytica]